MLHARDAAAATEGGADRLLLRSGEDGVGTTPDPAVLSAVVRETDLPVRVVLRRPDERSDEEYGLGAATFDRLAEDAGALRGLGADSFSFGFLDPDLRIDRASCAELAAEVGTEWGFHRAFDMVLDADRGWRDVAGLPRLDAVASAGSPRGMTSGGDELLARAERQPEVARLLLACGGLVAEQVPWLVRAGVRKFRVGASARPGRSWTRASVDSGHVRTWRMLLDDALGRSLGIPVD